jgi:DNA-binding MarR family transcriptional regulator
MPANRCDSPGRGRRGQELQLGRQRTQRAPQTGRNRTALRRTRLPERWRAELGPVDEDTVLIMAGLARLSRTVDEAYRAYLNEFGLTVSEYTALHTLRIAGPPYRLSPSRINEALALSSGGVTKTIDRLQSAGLVKRRPDPEDGRGVLVALTARGRKMAVQIFDAGLLKYSEAIESLGARERRQLVESLARLLDAFEAAAES